MGEPTYPASIAPVPGVVALQKLDYSSPAARDANLGTLLNAIMKVLNSMCFTVGGTAIGGTKTKAQLANTIQFSINGKAKTKAATDDLWTLTGFNCTNAKYNACWLYLDGNGAASIGAGTEAATEAGVVMPTPPAGKVVVGLLQVHVTGTGNFAGGTIDLDDVTKVPNAVFTDITWPGTLTALT